MKKTRTIIKGIIIFSFLALVSSCTGTEKSAEKRVITVSILPQKYFVERICGDQFTIQVMIPPGESPATYDPTTEQMINLSRSSVYFLIGHIQFEKSWIRGLADDYPGIRFYDTSEGIEFEHLDHEGTDHDHDGMDPHIWMSVPHVKKIAANMAHFLCSVYPENQDVYLQNLEIFHRDLDSLHQSIKSELNGLQNKEFIIYHPALTYFAKDYQLVQIPIENEGKEPSARYMRTLIDRAVASNIKAILVQQQFNQQEAVTIRKEIGGRLIMIDPLSEEWMKEMSSIAQELNSALN